MSYLLSISFKNFSFRNEITKFVLETFKLKSIEYEKDFDWLKTNKQDVFGVETSQIKFILKNGSQLFIQNMNNSLPRIYGSKVNFEMVCQIQTFVEINYLDLISMGFINDYSDYTLQNETEVAYFKQKKGFIPTYVQIISNPNYVDGTQGMDMIPKEFISIESLPGHSHQMNYDEKLWFGSCWQMYFSPIYYKYIPKFLFDDFTDCFETKIFENGLRRITLFENIGDYDLPENRAKQMNFRRALGIDSIAHELTKSINRIEPKDLPVLITKQNCKIGKIKVTRFLDENDRLISSDKAIKKEEKEYLEDGITTLF